MNKAVIIAYIYQIKEKLALILAQNPFKDVIIKEIFSDAVVTLDDISQGDKTDEEIAKGLMIMSIETFYTPKRIEQLEDKYRNYKNRILYGIKEFHITMPDTIVKFRMAFDITRKTVIDEKNSLIAACKDCKLKNDAQDKMYRSFIDKYFKIAVIVLLAYLAIILSTNLYSSHTHITSVQSENKAGREDVAVYISQYNKSAKTYHKDESCQYLYNRMIECMSESDAVKKGYKPCAACTGNNTVN